MSGHSVSASINTFSAGGAAIDIFSPGPAKLLEKDDQFWGVIQSVRPVGSGLIEVVMGFSRMAFLLPEDLMEKVQGLVGKRAVAQRVNNRFFCEGLE